MPYRTCASLRWRKQKKSSDERVRNLHYKCDLQHFGQFFKNLIFKTFIWFGRHFSVSFSSYVTCDGLAASHMHDRGIHCGVYIKSSQLKNKAPINLFIHLIAFWRRTPAYFTLTKAAIITAGGGGTGWCRGGNPRPSRGWRQTVTCDRRGKRHCMVGESGQVYCAALSW